MEKLNLEYEDLYLPDEEDSRLYEEFSESEPLEDQIEELRGTISRGSCLYCGCKNGMTYEGNCFVCGKCKMGVHEDTYYAWILGEDIQFDD